MVDGPQALPVGPVTPLLIERQRDRARRQPVRIILEDPTNHCRLFAVDLPIASDKLAVSAKRVHDLIAIGIAAAGLPSLDSATQPAPGLVGEVLQIERIHRALEADMQLGDLTLGQRDDLDAGKAEPLENRRSVFPGRGKDGRATRPG